MARQSLLFALSTGAAVCALIALGRSHRPPERRKQGNQDVRQAPNPTPDLPPEDGTDRDALLNRALEEKTTLDELERAYIVRALEYVEGNRTRAAEILDIDRRTLYRKMEEYGLSDEVM